MVCPHSLGNVLSKGPSACLYSTFNVAFALGLGACWYYSRNLDIPPFLWSACRVHLMSPLPLALGHAVLFSQPPHSPISVVSQCFQMSSLHYNNLNVIQLYIHVIRSFVALVYNFLGKLNYFVIKVSAT